MEDYKRCNRLGCSHNAFVRPSEQRFAQTHRYWCGMSEVLTQKRNSIEEEASTAVELAVAVQTPPGFAFRSVQTSDVVCLPVLA